MGYGGALIWTAVARNLRRKDPSRKVIFVYRNRWKDFLLGRPCPDADIYKGNPDIFLAIDQRWWTLCGWIFSRASFVAVDMNDPAARYWDGDSGDRVFYKKGRHAIEFACDAFGIKDPVLRPRVEFSRDERSRVAALLESHGLGKGRFICVEPQVKLSFSPNKEWVWERWQELVQRLNTYFQARGLDHKIVQIGPRGKVLDGVVDLTGQTSFREAGLVLEQALTYVGYMGGLVHMAKAVGKKNVVLVSAFEPLGLGSYPDDINLYSEIDCKECGWKIPCPNDRECMRRIRTEDVLKAVLCLVEAPRA